LLKILVLIETDFILNNFDIKNTTNGSVTWKTPSNIALVKYWGKQEPQIPENTSISFTLDACFTLTTLEYELKPNRHSELVSESYDENMKQVQVDENNLILKSILKVKRKMILNLKSQYFLKELNNMFLF